MFTDQRLKRSFRMLTRHVAIPTRMMLRQSSFSVTEPLPVADADRSGNGQIRQLLKGFGLRTSLIRLKVLDALLGAAEEGQCLGVRGVHNQLLKLDIPLSFLSVREVLKRLCDEGVICLNQDKTYRLHPQAAQLLAAQ